jgi:predicted ester cyclase
MSDDLRSVYERMLLDLWNEDLEKIDERAREVADPELVIHQARPGRTASESDRGPSALARLVKQGRTPFHDTRVSIEVGPVVEDDLVAARWRFEATYPGGMAGASAAPGTKVRFGGNDIVRFRDGLAIEYWVSSDDSSLMAQLGAS